MKKKFKIIISIFILSITILCGFFAYSYYDKESTFKSLLSEANTCLSDENYEKAESLYTECLSLKESAEIREKLDNIKEIKETLSVLDESNALAKSENYDDALKLLENLSCSSEKISSEISTKKDEFTKAKNDLLEKEKLAKQEAEKKKIENNQKINAATPTNNTKKSETNNSPSKNINVKSTFIGNYYNSKYIPWEKVLNITTNDYFKTFPNANPDELLFYGSMADGSYYVDIVKNKKSIYGYEVSPIDGVIACKHSEGTGFYQP